MATDRPNILLVVMDTARADAFEPYGAPPGSSPTLAQLARSGRSYQAFAPACWTVPSHAAMFSGLPYRAAGFGAPASTHADHKAAGDRLRHRWLPAVLRDNGYSTAAASTNAWVSALDGFDRGFDIFEQVTGARALHTQHSSWRHRSRWALQALRARTDDGATIVRGFLHRWLTDQPDGRPFFWFVNLVECHSPYLPPKPYNHLSAVARLRAGEEALRYLNFDAIWRGLCSRTEAPPAALNRMRGLYADAIRLMDGWLAQVLEALDAARLLDETIVIVTSDHGENLGESGLLGHGFSLDDRLLRVPLVVRGPTADLPTPVASLVDIPAWLAASAGLQDHPWKLGAGQVAVAEFDAPVSPDDRRVDGGIREWRLGEEARSRLTTSFTCATNGRRKLFRRLGREEIINLDTDHLESAPEFVGAETELRWADELIPLRAALDEAGAIARPGVTSVEPLASSSEEITDMEGQMKLLGYL